MKLECVNDLFNSWMGKTGDSKADSISLTFYLESDSFYLKNTLSVSTGEVLLGVCFSENIYFALI